MSNNTNPSARAPENTPVGRAIALHHCLGETVSVYWVPKGQKGVFLVLRGHIYHAPRQLVGSTISNKRYMLSCAAGSISFSPEDVLDITDHNTVITLKP
jgi:hypothetical protein